MLGGMNNFTRRDAIRVSITAAAAAGALSSATKKPLGVQLYSVRGVLGEKAAATLKRIADAGYKKAETVRATQALVVPICQDLGISVVSGHYETGIATGNAKAWPSIPAGYTWEKAVEDAAKAGQKYMVIPYVQAAERGGADVYKRLAEQMNKCGEISRKAGLMLAYHHHAFEFGTVEGGARPIDLLLAADPANVFIEMDVFWVAVAGEDPVALLHKWKGRVKLMHLKDRAPGTPKQFAENVSPAAFREIGNGTLDFKAILKAARETGVEHFFVEQDQVAGDPVEALAASYQRLEKLGF